MITVHGESIITIEGQTARRKTCLVPLEIVESGIMSVAIVITIPGMSIFVSH